MKYAIELGLSFTRWKRSDRWEVRVQQVNGDWYDLLAFFRPGRKS